MTIDNPITTTDTQNILINQFSDRKDALGIEAALEELNFARRGQESQKKEARIHLLGRLSQTQDNDIAQLEPEATNLFANAQRASTTELAQVIRGEISDSDISFSLSRREWQLVEKVRVAYHEFKKQHPTENFIPVFSQAEERLLWDTMIKRESLKRVSQSPTPPDTLPPSTSINTAEPAADTPELDKPVNHEHIFNAPSMRIVPDTHGLDPAFYGVDINSTNIVSVGDLIDAPKNLNANKMSADDYRKLLQRDGNRTPDQIDALVANFERINAAARSVDIKKSVEVWADLLESDRGQVVLGNHELMALSGLSGNDADLWQWITDSNKGGTTLEAFGISAPTVIYDKDSGFNPPVSQTECTRIRQEVQNNPTLQKFFDQLRLKGKMYVIANEALIVHAGIPVGQNGELIPPQRAGKAFQGFESLTGLDAFEAIESELRKSPPNLELLHWLGNGSSKEMTPGWVREPFFDVMNDPQKASKVREELRQQAQVRGGNINIIMIGHTEKVGGKRVGDVVFGTDTAVGDIVTLEREAQANNPNQDQVKMIARHNFGSKTDQRPFGYNASKS